MLCLSIFNNVQNSEERDLTMKRSAGKNIWVVTIKGLVRKRGARGRSVNPCVHAACVQCFWRQGAVRANCQGRVPSTIRPRHKRGGLNSVTVSDSARRRTAPLASPMRPNPSAISRAMCSLLLGRWMGVLM